MRSCLKGEIHSSLRVRNSSFELGVGSAVVGDSIEGVGVFPSTGLTFSGIAFVFGMFGSGASGLTGASSVSVGSTSLGWCSDSLLVKKEPTFWK